MKEILFKAKRIDNGEWIEGGFCQSSDGKTYIIGVSKRAKLHGIPVIAVVGGAEGDMSGAYEKGVKATFIDALKLAKEAGSAKAAKHAARTGFPVCYLRCSGADFVCVHGISGSGFLQSVPVFPFLRRAHDEKECCVCRPLFCDPRPVCGIDLRPARPGFFG